MSGAVHTRVEVRRMYSEMSRLVEWPWLQLMCCAVCLPHGCNFRWRRESLSGSECWMVCRHWTPEIEFNKRLSSSIIRLANYSVTTSLIYNWYYKRCSGFQCWDTDRSNSVVEDRIHGGLQHCHKTCCEKGGRRGRQVCMIRRWHHHGDVVFQTGGLVYDSIPPLGLSLWSPIEFIRSPIWIIQESHDGT